MRKPVPTLLLMGLMLAVPGVAPPGTDPTNVRNANRQLLDKWRDSDPAHYARLKKDLYAFAALTAERQTQLRRLDHELHRQDATTQKRLWGALERYHVWLGQLNEDDRRRVRQAPAGEARRRVIQEIRDRQWLESLPNEIRKALGGLMPPERRVARIKQLKQEEQQRRNVWRNLHSLDPDILPFVQ